MKSRANRYIAGRSEADLFPERNLKVRQWNRLGEFLMPPKHKIMNQSGYTVVAYGDGSYLFQDQFGRRPASKAEYDREVVKAERMRAELDAILKRDAAARRRIADEG